MGAMWLVGFGHRVPFGWSQRGSAIPGCSAGVHAAEAVLLCLKEGRVCWAEK